MKADIIKSGTKIGEISFSEGSLSISCDDSSLRDRIYLHITSPEATEENQVKKLEAMKGTEHGTLEYFKATLEFIDEMESDFDIKYSD
ncbi:MAG: hypothetical protein JW984_13430 [Deltaproteobacteria bacterium]|uniref:Uncharacterized protein n=1 Tax=Candidatus Zymogenus saltonus TaxID=2844893 RepID=A0A9D8KGS1_9DELT|nr:hypothetical protein [Candidatus Zymogenus saltonus]